MHLKLPVYVIIVISFHNQQKKKKKKKKHQKTSKLHIPRIFDENLEINIFPVKIWNICFVFCLFFWDTDVIKTSLWRQIKGYR